jgi:NAD-dependent SIR2 family protein deacetylase
MEQIVIPKLSCTRCKDKKTGDPFSWIPRVEHPKTCPNCKSPYWDRPRKEDRSVSTTD